MKDKTFYITYYANKHGKHVTRQGKHGDKSRYGVNKKGVEFYVYFDLNANNYRCANAPWKVRN